MSQAGTLLRGLPESLSFAMSNSVLCTEDVPFVDPSARDGLADTYLGTTIVDSLNLICSRWPAGEIDSDFKTPVRSDRPVLLLSGSNDPITPPDYAQTSRRDAAEQRAARRAGSGARPVARRLRAAAHREIHRRSEPAVGRGGLPRRGAADAVLLDSARTGAVSRAS